jgi:hypothetical protein
VVVVGLGEGDWIALEFAPKGAEGATRRATSRQRVDARVELITMARKGVVGGLKNVSARNVPAVLAGKLAAYSESLSLNNDDLPTAVCERVEGGRSRPVVVGGGLHGIGLGWVLDLNLADKSEFRRISLKANVEYQSIQGLWIRSRLDFNDLVTELEFIGFHGIG